MFQPTQLAHQLVEEPFSRAILTVAPTMLSHTLAVAEAATRFPSESNVIAERTIASAVAVATALPARVTARAVLKGTPVRRRPAPHGTFWTRAGKGYSTHAPDLILEDAASRTLVEIERSPKSRTQYTDLLRGMYEAVAGGRFTDVVYLVPSGTVGERIRRLVLEAADHAMLPDRWGDITNCWDPQGRSRPIEQWLEVITFDPQFDLNSGPDAP